MTYIEQDDNQLSYNKEIQAPMMSNFPIEAELEGG